MELYLQGNDITGTIQDCNKTVIRADSNIPIKIMCECCQGFGIYNNPIAYEEEFPTCPSSELNIIFDNDIGDVIVFDLKNEANELKLTELSISEKKNMNYRTCISETDCYILESPLTNSNGKIIPYHLIIDGNMVAKYDENITHFGFSGPNTLTRNTCENYTICDVTLIPDTENRKNFNSLFNNIHSLSDFDNQTLSPYKALCWWLEHMQHADESRQSDTTQRYLLALFYYYTNGDHWINHTNWMSNKSECEWHGVTCNEDSTLITKINLDSNNLAGPIPTELGELRGLESLVLSSNNLTGLLAHEMTKLEMLEVLNISDNTLKGSLTPYIRFFSHLTEIDLSSNIFTSTLPITISYLTNIQHINLSNNSFSGELPSELNNFTKLKVLDVSNNLFEGNVTMIKEVRSLSKFHYIDI